MNTLITLVGIIITIPSIIIEALIKISILMLCIPVSIYEALLYPLFKAYNIELITLNMWKYATTWKKGFYTANIRNLWKID